MTSSFPSVVGMIISCHTEGSEAARNLAKDFNFNLNFNSYKLLAFNY